MSAVVAGVSPAIGKTPAARCLLFSPRVFCRCGRRESGARFFSLYADPTPTFPAIARSKCQSVETRSRAAALPRPTDEVGASSATWRLFPRPGSPVRPESAHGAEWSRWEPSDIDAAWRVRRGAAESKEKHRHHNPNLSLRRTSHCLAGGDTLAEKKKRPRPRHTASASIPRSRGFDCAQ